MEHTFYTSNTADLDSTFSIKNENVTISSNIQFLPKNQKKLSYFINEFFETRNQLLLSESPANLLFKKEDNRDLYYHIFDKDAFISWENRSQVLLVYLEGEVDLKNYSEHISQYASVILVQGRLGSFRTVILTKSQRFSMLDEECFDFECSFMNNSDFSRHLMKSSKNFNI